MKGKNKNEEKVGGKDYLEAKATPALLSPPGRPGAQGAEDSGGGAAVRDAIAPRRLRAFRSPRPGVVPSCVSLVAGRVGGYRSPWVAASPLAFGLLPGQPLRRWEDDNCPETRPLSGWVVQSAQERGPRAEARTPQRPGMRAGARGGRGSRCRRCPLDGKSCRWPA